MEKQKFNFKEWVLKNKTDLIVYFGFILVLILLISLAVIPQNSKIKEGIEFSPTAVSLGSLSIQWYAIFILSGIILAAYMATQEFKRFEWKTDDLLDGLLIIVPLSIIGARLYYVLFDPNANIKSIVDVFAIWDGGLAIHGGIIVATIGIIIFSKYKKLNIFALADILALGLLMGQISGRWGNFMNAEAHGGATTSAFLNSILPNFIKHQMHFGDSTLVGNMLYHPTFLYESLWNFVGFTILFILRRKRVLKLGDMMGIYLIWYGFGRGLLVEPLRTDQLMIFNIPVNILLSLVLFVGGGIVYLILKRVYNKDEEFYFDFSIKNKDEVLKVFKSND